MLKDAKLADGFERGGNRAHQPSNRNLRHGLDLGGVRGAAVEGVYLPAWKRYTGRCYVPVEESAWRNYPIIGSARFLVLIMSGLYGLVEAQEKIQEYDVHLTDTHVDSGQSVKSMWSELLTETIEIYIQQAFRGRKVNIFNLLCDRHYVGAIQWHELSKECSVFHLGSPSLEDVELLPSAGTILNYILIDPEKLEHISRDEEYSIAKFGTPPPGQSDVHVIFDSRFGLSRSDKPLDLPQIPP